MGKTSSDSPKHSFSKIKDCASAATIALAAVILLCFVPDLPFGISESVPSDHLEETKAEAIHETYMNTLKIKVRDVALTLAGYRWGPAEISNRIEQEFPVPLEYSSKVLEYYQIFRSKQPAVPKVIPSIFEPQNV
jgi:hypothetical protein